MCWLQASSAQTSLDIVEDDGNYRTKYLDDVKVGKADVLRAHCLLLNSAELALLYLGPR